MVVVPAPPPGAPHTPAQHCSRVHGPHPASGAEGPAATEHNPPCWHRQKLPPPNSARSHPQPMRPEGLGHSSHSHQRGATSQQDLDHQVGKLSELAASPSRPTSPKPPGLRHHLISVHVGAGAARRVLQRGAGPAGDLLSPGPGPPLKAPPLQCQFSSQTCFDPSATHTSQLYSKTPPEQRTTQSKSARSIFKFKNASSIALFYPRLPNACFSKQNITKDHIFIL